MIKDTELNNLIKEISLDIRFKVNIEMGLISFLCDNGFRDDKPWNENDKKEMGLLNKIIEFSENLSDELIKEINQWKQDAKDLEIEPQIFDEQKKPID